MRFADLIWLSLSALLQQKLRGLLTTLGVVFGAFVLVFSLSLGQGVQNTIEHESHHTDFLRKINVHPAWQKSPADLAKEEVQVVGDMSEDKRQRLRQALIDRKAQYSWSGPRTALNQERLQALRNLDHVVSVTPFLQQQGWAILGAQTQPVITGGVDPDYAQHRERLIAGDFFQRPDERGVVLSELTCYLLGATGDADVQRVIGHKLRLEYRTEPQPVGINVYLYKGKDNTLTHQEMVALEKIKQQLPTTLDRFDLTAEDRAALRPSLQAPPQPTVVYQEDFTIVGVVRLPTKAEQEASFEPRNRFADVLLPPQTAEEISFRQKDRAALGADEATILVDREENVRAVLQQVQAMNLQAYSPVEYIDRERFIYLLIFSTMACVAAVALLVAALGIANTMLMSVLERTREIGIFKAVGAGDGTVQLVFLIEGAFIGLIGGVMGLLFGWLASFPANAWVRDLVSRDLKVELKESLFVFPWWLAVSVVLFAVIVTTLAAVFPARRAARVNPVTALRSE